MLIQTEPGRVQAVAGIERAIENPMPHTQFRDAGRKPYLLAVTGTLSLEQEEMIQKLDLMGYLIGPDMKAQGRC